MDAPLLASATDPDGRTIVLDAAGWRHVTQNHPEMADHLPAIVAALSQPDRRDSDPRPGRRRYYRESVGPSRWCLVVVDFAHQPARVVTAFGIRRLPEVLREP